MFDSCASILKHKRPFVVAGPCSAESEMQVMQTASQLHQFQCVDVFRAGLWKPRTRPNHFEGVGKKGIDWLINVRKEFGFKVTTEVANAKHVEIALKAGIDWLWVGARTTANPFSVQEIADALAGADVPLLVKNPINADLELWIGALERFSQAGSSKIVAVHRGFSSPNKNEYRNSPFWSIPIELKRQFPHLEMLCDPSHIAGNTFLIRLIAQKAMDLEMNGLMIETHFDPKTALSDAKQQITPLELHELLQHLVIRKTITDDPETEQQLLSNRKRIDELDSIILELLAERLKIVQEIGSTKKEKELTILQIQRWDEIIKDRILEGQKLHLSEEFIKKMMDVIHAEAIQLQADIMNNEEIFKL